MDCFNFNMIPTQSTSYAFINLARIDHTHVLKGKIPRCLNRQSNEHDFREGKATYDIVIHEVS